MSCKDCLVTPPIPETDLKRIDFESLQCPFLIRMLREAFPDMAKPLPNADCSNCEETNPDYIARCKEYSHCNC